MTKADALFASALALERAGQSAKALDHYRAALKESPSHADAWHNHGLLLARLGRLGEAEQSHRAYLRAHPQSTRARCDLADVLLAFGRYSEVIEIIGESDEATALVRRGVALSCLRRFDEARGTFAAARRINLHEVARFASHVAPGANLDTLFSPENIFICRHYMALGDCDWSRWDAYVSEMRTAAHAPEIALEAATAFMAFHLPLSAGERHDIARHIAARIEAVNPPLPAPAPRCRTRVRVGLLSPDFREHLEAYRFLALFELLDRARFEIIAYSVGLGDESHIRSRVLAAADVFRDLHGTSDGEVAAAIRGDDVDILLDGTGHMTGGRFAVMARRPARVQASLVGFPGSLGSRRIDYAIVDRVIAPYQEEWTEKLVYLPHTFYLYDFRTPVGDMRLTRADYGLPEDAFVFCAFHKAEKITPDAFDLWTEVLRRVPGSVLWFRALTPAAIRNLRALAAARGIDPARLFFAPFEPNSDPRYLAKHRLGDLMLDALHHNAITTACDALGAGLPLLTLRGATAASRAGESLVRAAGLPELVAPDRQSFTELAVRLASEPDLLARYRSRLVRNRSIAPLFDTAGRVREIEGALEHMLETSAQRQRS